MKTLKERLVSARKAAGLTQAQLAQQANLSQSTVAQIESGRNAGTKFASLLAKPLGVTIEWLLTGRGEPLHKNAAEEAMASSSIDQSSSGEFMSITEPWWNDDANCIEWDFVVANVTKFHDSFFDAHNVKPSNCRLFINRSNAMEPYLFSEEWVMINIADKQVRDGDIYAFLFADYDFVIRRVIALPNGGLRLKAFNPQHEPFDIAPADVPALRLMGKVIYRSGSQRHSI